MSTRKLEFSRGEVIADKYEVVDQLEELPLGPSYRVKHLKSGKYVRLVLLRPKLAGREQKDQIIRGFKVAREVSNPHLVKVGELGDHQGIGYFTYEDLEGGTLRSLIQEFRASGRQFDVREASQIAIQILDGLQSMHDAGMVLRALRPEYVQVSVKYTGPRKQTFVAQVKLVGAGFWDLVPTAALAEDEFTRGEAQYMAPELKSFEPVATPRSDVYSAGVMLYEMLTGAAPAGTFHAPKSRRPDIPDHLAEVIEMAISHAPDDRHSSANDFRNDIQRTFADAGVPVEAETRRLLSPVATALASVLILALAAIVYLSIPNPEKDAAEADTLARNAIIEGRASMPDNLKELLDTHPNMTFVPGGKYLSGRLNAESRDIAMSSEPVNEVVDIPAYWIDVFEYPNVLNGAPQFGVSFEDASGVCAAQGKRLCSANEWEKACKGPEAFVYGYGDTFDADFCGNGTEDIQPSGAKPECRTKWTPLQIFDLAGNFREWTSTSPKGNENRKLVKGGLKNNPTKGSRCAFATDEAIVFKDNNLSFRCCMDATAPPPHAPAEPAAAPNTP